MTRGYVSLALWPCVAPQVALLIGLPFAAAFVVRWLYYWLAVSTLVDFRARLYIFFSRAAGTVFFQWLPLLYRSVLVCLLLLDVLRNLLDAGDRAERYAALGFAFPELTLVLFTLIEFAGAVLVALGILGRYAAFALLFPVLLPVLLGSSNDVPTVTLLAVVLVLIFDTGAFSRWRPDDVVFRRRPGGRVHFRGVPNRESSRPAGVGESCGAGGRPSENI
jgi:hypothetical protein